MNKIDSEGARRMVGGRTRDPLMSKMDQHAMGVDDFYASPPSAVEALLRVEKFTGPIWEPACGDGAISKVLIAAGYDVVSTDLVNRGYCDGRVDFLMESMALAPNIITNPPFKNALAFAKQATHLSSGKVAFLLRLVWLEGAARKKFFEQSKLSRVWVFSKRIPRMNRGGYTGPVCSSSIAFAWFIWDKDHTGPTELGVDMISERDCIARRYAPSPFADAVARMFLSGAGVHAVAKKFNIDVTEVAALVKWVCETNMRRATS